MIIYYIYHMYCKAICRLFQALPVYKFPRRLSTTPREPKSVPGMDMGFNEAKCNVLHLDSTNPCYAYSMRNTSLEALTEEDL